MAIETQTAADPTSPRDYPVAKPAPPRPKLTCEPPPEFADELFTPSSIKGWAWSLVMHALILLMLAFWYFSPHLKPTTGFDSRMAGSEFGDESGTSLKGGLGMDTPLAMPEGPDPALNEVAPVITSLPASSLKLDITPTNRPASTAANGGGVNLTNPGQAGSGDGFGVAKFGHGGENINGIDVKVGDPQFTLIWDTKADLDLHVLEPSEDGKSHDEAHIFWENRNAPRGGELDVDDVDGFGPENVYWGGGTSNGPLGNYQWFVHYYGGQGGIASPTRWKVRVKHEGKVTVYEGKLTFIGQKSRTYQLRVEAPPRGTPRDTSEKTDGAVK